MTLTAIVGALVAFVARPAKPAAKEDPRFIAGYDAGLNDGRLEREALTRSHAQLVDQLERELAIEREIAAHWRETAQHIARDSREAREERDRLRQCQRGMATPPTLQQAMAEQQAAQMNAQAAMQAAQYQQSLAQQNAYQGFCNCVPSRSQVWLAHGGLVQDLNAIEGQSG